MFESARAASGASAVDRCEIITDHGPGEASDLLRGGLGGPGLGLDVGADSMVRVGVRGSSREIRASRGRRSS